MNHAASRRKHRAPRPAVGSEDDDCPGGCLVRQPQRPWSRRGQQDEGGRRPSAAPAVTRHPLAVTPLSSPAANKNNAVVTKFTKKQHVEIDHRADMPRPLWGEYSRCTR